jgi:hypothetical protein
MSETPLAVVTFKWRKPGYRSTFTAKHVNVLRRMVARHYKAPHRFVCITDDADGFDPEIEVLPIWDDYANVPSPHGIAAPSCYRRLKVFTPEMSTTIGPRFLCLDLDTVILGDVRAIFDRTEDFIIWGETDPRSFYNGSMFMMTAGARKQVWDDFKPDTSPMEAYRAGKFGSDQGWISYRLGHGEATWSTKDGVYSYRKHIETKAGRLPADAKIVHFHGKHDPDSRVPQRLDWVRKAYV